MYMYLGLVAWGLVAYIVFKTINHVLYKRQLAGESRPSPLRDSILM